MEKKIAVGGVILAAGRGERFGGEKLLAPLAGGPLGRRAVEAALSSRLAQVVLVTRPELAKALNPDPERVKTVLNDNPAAGQSLSTRLGLAALDKGMSHALFLLADQPLVDAGLIDRFVAAAESGAELAAVLFEGAFRPPSLFGRAYFAELNSLSGDEGGRSLLGRHFRRVVGLEPAEAAEVADVDSPEDLEKIRRRLG